MERMGSTLYFGSISWPLGRDSFAILSVILARSSASCDRIATHGEFISAAGGFQYLAVKMAANIEAGSA
jgi:hypothetical protein